MRKERSADLEDFDSAGKTSGFYHTWLPLGGLGSAVFVHFVVGDLSASPRGK